MNDLARIPSSQIAASQIGRLLPHMATLILNVPLMVTSEKLDVVLSVLGPRMGLDIAPADLVAAVDTGAGPAADNGVMVLDNGIAIIPVEGTLVHKASGLDALSGLTAYADLANAVRAAAADPAVTGIFYPVDSSGGSTQGVFDLADEIRAAAQLKPSAAIAADYCCSAAYLIGAAAGRLFTTQSGLVGSIGVVGRHVDRSQSNAQNGLKVTYVSAGEGKTHGNADEPLTDASLATLQSRVDSFYGAFVDKIAAFRDLAPSALRTLGAKVLRGPEAVAAGLADAVATEDQAMAWLEQQVSDRRAPSSKKGNAMDKPAWMTATVITPEIVAAFQAECGPLFAAVQAAGMKTGASAERDRLTSLAALAEPGEEELLAKFNADGTDVATAALAFAEGRKSRRAAALKARTDDTPQPVPTTPRTGAEDTGAQDDRVAADLTDEEMTAKFEKSAPLKAEFATAADYVAFARMSAAGRVRVKTDRPAV